MTGRLGIDDVRPQISSRQYPAKAVVGEVTPVSAVVWREGHDAVNATLTVIGPNDTISTGVTMQPDHEVPDLFHAVFVPDEVGTWRFRVDAWSDSFATWHNAVDKPFSTYWSTRREARC